MDRLAFLTLAAAPRIVQAVALPNGDRAFVRLLTAGEVDTMSAEAADLEADGHGPRARQLMHAVCDHQGAAIFTHADLPDIANLPLHIADALFEAAVRLNKLGPDGEAEVKND